MAVSTSDTCARCGASARTTPHTVRFDDNSTWTAVLCPRHYSQIIDFLELGLTGWDKGYATGEVVPVVTDLDLPVKKRRGRPRKEAVAAPPVPKAVAVAEKPAKKPTPATKKLTPAGGYDPAEVRAWAHANKVDVSRRGRISSSVVDAWRAASGSENPIQPIASRSLESARNKTVAKKRNKPSVLFSASNN